MKTRLGADHPDTLQSMNNLAMSYSKNGQRDKALPLLEQTLQLRKARLGDDHPDTLQSMNNLALTYNENGQTAKAMPLLEETFQLRKSKLGADHPDTLTSMSNLALGYRGVGRLDAALPLWQEALELRRSKLGADHPDTLTSMSNLAAAYRALGQFDKALPLFEEAARGVEKRRYRHEHAQGIITQTIRAYEAAKQPEQAQGWRWKWLTHIKETAGAESQAYADVLGIWGMRQLQLEKWAEAEAALRDCVAILEQAQPNGWMTSYVRSMLGGALLGQKKYQEAEPLLIKSYEGMTAQGERSPGANPAGSPSPKLILESLDRLIDLYSAMEKPEEVKKWRAEREKLQSVKASGAAPP
jgi:tetratricopeptide (TPR) repeat protein